MSTIRVINNATALKQISTITVSGTWTTADTATVTVGGQTLVITIGALVTTTQVATTIKEALLGSTLTDTTASCIPSIGDSGGGANNTFYDFIATSATNIVTLTARTAGKPFVEVSTESTASSGAVADSTTTAAVGPGFWTATANYSGAAVPVDNDTVVWDTGNGSMLYGLTAAIQPAAVVITQGFTGKIGLAEQNIDNTDKKYGEYRTPTYLTFDDNSVTCTYTIGEGLGSGSGRIKINAGAGQSSWVIRGSGTRELSNVPAILLKGTHASNALSNFNGDVGVAFYTGETAVLATLINGDGPNSSAQTYCGAGVTLSSATVTMNGGKLETNSAISAVNQYGGEWIHRSGNVTTLTVFGGTTNWQAGSATIATLKIASGGTFDKSNDSRPLTITNAVLMYKGSTLKDPSKSITFSAGITLVNCTLDDVTLDVGPNRTLTIS